MIPVQIDFTYVTRDHESFDILGDVSSKNNTKSKYRNDVDTLEVLFIIYACNIISTLQSDLKEIEQLNEDQVLCILQYLLQKDAFAVLPTGFGNR